MTNEQIAKTAAEAIIGERKPYSRDVEDATAIILAAMERDDKGLANKELVEAAESLCPPEDADVNYWWCPGCRAMIPGTQVSYTEHCESCGTYLTDCQIDDKWARLRAAIAAYRGRPKEDKVTITSVCANCGEAVSPCKCMRSKCAECGGPVGNVTFTTCDACWDKEHPKEDKAEKVARYLLGRFGAVHECEEGRLEFMDCNSQETLAAALRDAEEE